MSWDDFDPEPSEPEYEPPGPGDDPSVQELEPLLLAYLDEHLDTVFYETQLAVIFEKNFFHWVTARALRDLREADKIGSSLEELSPKVPLRFYFSRRCRHTIPIECVEHWNSYRSGWDAQQKRAGQH